MESSEIAECVISNKQNYVDQTGSYKKTVGCLQYVALFKTVSINRKSFVGTTQFFENLLACRMYGFEA